MVAQTVLSSWASIHDLNMANLLEKPFVCSFLPLIGENKMEINNSADYILNESLGSFKMQKEIAKYIAKNVVDQQFSPVVVDLSSFDNEFFKMANVIPYFMSVMEPSAAIDKVDSDGIIRIVLTLSHFYKESVSKNKQISQISYIIAHELMHANILFNQNKHKSLKNDTPSYYSNALSMKENIGSDNMYGVFAYALYNTYYQERQAFISETESELNTLIKKLKDATNDTLKDAVKDTTGYQVYANNIYYLKRLKNDNEAQKRLFGLLKTYNINLSESEIAKKIDEMLILSENTIRLIYRNAMLIFENNGEKD